MITNSQFLLDLNFYEFTPKTYQCFHSNKDIRVARRLLEASHLRLRPCPPSVVFIHGCHPWMASTDDTSIHGWHFSIHGWHPWMAFLHPWMTLLHPWMTSLHPWITSTDDISPSIDGISPSMDDISPSMDDIHGWHYSIHGWHFHPYDFWWKLYASHFSNENSSPIIVIVLKS